MTTWGKVVFVLLIVWSTPSLGDELTSGKRADIEQLLEMTDALAVGQQMGSAVVLELTRVLRETRPDIPESVLSALPEQVDVAIAENLDSLEEVIIPLYHKHFTAEEIKEMIHFYSTPLGQKTIQVMPDLMIESFQVGQEWGGKILGPAIEAGIQARLRKDGLEL